MISWGWFYIHRETRYCRHLSQRHWPESCGLCGLCGHLVVLWKISHMASNQRIFSISLWDHLFVGLSHVFRISLIIEKKRNKNAFTYTVCIRWKKLKLILNHLLVYWFLEFIICSMLLYNDDVHSPVTTESGSPIQPHVNANIRLLHGSDQMHMHLDVVKTTCWSSKRSIRENLDFELGLVACAGLDGLVWGFHKLPIYWDLHARLSMEFSENGNKNIQWAAVFFLMEIPCWRQRSEENWQTAGQKGNRNWNKHSSQQSHATTWQTLEQMGQSFTKTQR